MNSTTKPPLLRIPGVAFGIAASVSVALGIGIAISNPLTALGSAVFVAISYPLCCFTGRHRALGSDVIAYSAMYQRLSISSSVKRS